MTKSKRWAFKVKTISSSSDGEKLRGPLLRDFVEKWDTDVITLFDSLGRDVIEVY